jgi:small subunit ribosomal protein S17
MAEENEDAVTSDDPAARAQDETVAEDDATQAASSSEAAAEQPAQAVTSSEATAQQPAKVAEALAPKERRARTRAAKAAAVPAGPTRSAEERWQERLAERRRKAQQRQAQRQRARAKAKAGKGAVDATAAREHIPGVQKTRQGVVVSDRADKTITVRIDFARRHRRYEKIVRTSRTLRAHDERNDAHVGDTVIVRESRPLSRTKHWRLVEVLERAK